MSFAGWSWRVRETKPKPPAGCLAVLWMLGSRMDAGYGCGFASLKVLAEDAAVGEATAKRAITWARGHLLLNRAARGHHVTGGRAVASEWQLCDPGEPTAQGGAAGAGPTAQGEPVANEPTAQEEPVGEPTAQEKPVGSEPTAQEKPVGSEPTAQEKPVGSEPTAHLGRANSSPQTPQVSPTTSTPSKFKTKGADVVTSARVSANGGKPPPLNGKTNAALSLEAAQIHEIHVKQCHPPMPRAQIQQMGQLTYELIVNGHHDPGVVTTALAQWRDRRARGDRIGRGLLEWLIEQIELDGRRQRGGAGMAAYAEELRRQGRLTAKDL